MRISFVASNNFRVNGLVGCAKKLKSIVRDRTLDGVGFPDEKIFRFPRRISRKIIDRRMSPFCRNVNEIN